MGIIPSKNHESIKLPEKIKASLITVETSHGDLCLGYIEMKSQKLSWLIKPPNQSTWSIPEINEEEFVKSKNLLPTMEKVVAILDNKADFHIFFTQKQKTRALSLWTAVSHNYGRTWTEITQLSDELQEWDVFSSPIIIQNGLYVNRFVVPYTDLGTQRSAFLISQDNGKTWGSSLYLEPHEEAGMLDDDLSGGTLHPTIIENLDGHLRSFFHVLNWPKLYTAISPDLGETWSEATHIEDVITIDPTKAYDIKKIIDKTGQLTPLIVICGWVSNDQSGKKHSDEKSVDGKQGELKLFYSIEDGATLESVQTLYAGSYSSSLICHLFQDSAADLHIMYSIDQQSITHESIDITPLLEKITENETKKEKSDKTDAEDEEDYSEID